jgi:hypothetical protein
VIVRAGSSPLAADAQCVRQPTKPGDRVSNFALLYDDLEATIRHTGKPTLGLRAHLGGAYEAIIERPYDPDRVAVALEELLAYLSSREGRTHENCVTVDTFFCRGRGWEAGWEESRRNSRAFWRT